MRLEYFINTDERGEFYADVRTPKGKTIFEIHGGDIFEYGFMHHKHDTRGLLEYLRSIGIAKPGDSLTLEN